MWPAFGGGGPGSHSSQAAAPRGASGPTRGLQPAPSAESAGPGLVTPGWAPSNSRGRAGPAPSPTHPLRWLTAGGGTGTWEGGSLPLGGPLTAPGRTGSPCPPLAQGVEEEEPVGGAVTPETRATCWDLAVPQAWAARQGLAPAPLPLLSLPDLPQPGRPWGPEVGGREPGRFHCPVPRGLAPGRPSVPAAEPRASTPRGEYGTLVKKGSHQPQGAAPRKAGLGAPPGDASTGLLWPRLRVGSRCPRPPGTAAGLRVPPGPRPEPSLAAQWGRPAAAPASATGSHQASPGQEPQKESRTHTLL